MLDDLQAMTDAHVAELCELRALGMQIARQIAADVAAAETPAERKAAADSFPGITRAVRLCQALEARARRAAIQDAAEAAVEAEEARRAEQARAQEAAAKRRRVLDSRKDPVVKRVLRVIDDETGEDDIDAYCRLEEDLRTRLDDETFEDEFAGRPYEEVVRTIHRDLDLPEPEFGPQDRLRARIWDAQWASSGADRPKRPPAEPDRQSDDAGVDTPAAAERPPPFQRLAPPMDLPPWETG